MMLIFGLDPNDVTVITGLFALMATAFGVLNTWLVTRARVQIKETKEAVASIEKHTNGMHATLVEVTGAAQFQKGFAMGSGSSDPAMVAFAQLQQKDNEAREKHAGEALNKLTADEEAGRGSSS